MICIMTQISNKRPATPKQAAKRTRPIDSLLAPALFKALGDPTRVRLLACLAKCGRSCSVTEIAGCCSVDLSVVSRHLSMLHMAGILRAEKRSRTVFYSVEYRRFCDALRALADAVEECGPGGSPTGEACCGKC